MRALFEVGEEVLEGVSPGKTVHSTILKVEFLENQLCYYPSGERILYTGFSYLTTDDPENWIDEKWLRKIPKTTDFEEMMTGLNRETVCE